MPRPAALRATAPRSPDARKASANAPGVTAMTCSFFFCSALQARRLCHLFRARAVRVCARRPSDNPKARRRCAPPDDRESPPPAHWRRMPAQPPAPPSVRRYAWRARCSSRSRRRGFSRSACHTRCWNSVPRTSSGRSTPSPGASTKPTTCATSRSNCASPPLSRARGKRSWRSRARASGSSPIEIAHTPRSLCATRMQPSEHSPTAKRISRLAPPSRYRVGVMPSTWLDTP